MPEEKRPIVSVIIKAFNEERHIAGAIESALAALVEIEGEVILADGASTDRTVEIAQHYPIKIVRLNDPTDRSCGAGAQLGFQYSRGEFLFLMDGDMRLQSGFLAAGIGFLRDRPTVGGVGGGMIYRHAGGLEYEQRARRFDPDRGPGVVTHLGGCGLYRRAALDGVGYATDRNLHGGEELELAARLRAGGWTIAKIDHVAVEHFCGGGNSYALLLRRMKTRNACGPGEMIRASLGQPHFGLVVRDDRNSRLCALVALWWIAMATSALFLNGWDAVLATAALFAFPFAVMSWRWRSLRHGLYSVMAWNTQALCFLPGFLRPRKPPGAWMASTVVKDPLGQRA
jgi:glycosyltransferase involved in cell wall biosynthesis